MPTETGMDKAKRLAMDHLHAIQRLQHNNVKYNGQHSAALKALATTFKMKTDTIEHTHQQPMQTSTNPTDPANIRRAPRMHSRQTRANTPGILPPAAQIQSRTSEGEETAPHHWYDAPRKNGKERERLKIKKAMGDEYKQRVMKTYLGVIVPRGHAPERKESWKRSA